VVRVSETRARILAAVEDDPGIHFRGLARALDVAPGQVQYHLRELRRTDAVVPEAHRGRTHYYPPTYDPWERRAIAVLRRETARDVVAYLLEHGPSAPASVTSGVGVARSTLEWHLETLVEADLVEKRRGDGNRVTLVTGRPEETAALLATVAPSLAGRLVDRFERLVDALVEDA
jgi:predicted transcriptional regulator